MVVPSAIQPRLPQHLNCVSIRFAPAPSPTERAEKAAISADLSMEVSDMDNIKYISSPHRIVWKVDIVLPFASLT
jgi:hypothetical protein